MSLNNSKKTILIADDDPHIRTLLQTTLEAMDLIVVPSVDGEHALRLFNTVLPDMVILDVTMPKVIGTEVCRNIKSHREGPFIPVMLLTARDNMEEKLEAFSLGADEYLTKPFNSKEFMARVKILLRLRDLTLELNQKSEEILKLQNSLVEKERQNAVSQLVGGVAHELGQPVSAILLNSFLLEQNQLTDPKLNQAVMAIKTDARRLAEMIKNLTNIDASKNQDYHRDSKILKLSAEDLKLREKG